MTYQHPFQDTRFVLQHLVEFEKLAKSLGLQEIDQGLADAIVEEAGRFGAERIAPTNWDSDQHPPQLLDGQVNESPGLAAVYQEMAESGWVGLNAPIDFDGQGLPGVLGTAVNEVWHSANMAFALCPMLSQGAIEAIANHGDEALKSRFLSKLSTGEWTGTMNLTEPDAGSDLAAIKAKAEPSEGGHYRISGQKIYITWGDHQMTDNIVHLVLARLPDAPAGVKGISLFVVPKRLDDGSANAVRCLSLEHKLGIHASPTCVMQYDNAEGYLVGQPHQGLKYMFTMMNHARQAVGLQGLSISERSYQQAVGYARDRTQGSRPDGSKIAIIDFPDVRRMLLTMKSGCQAMRALALVASAQMDMAHSNADHLPQAEWFTPIVKGWMTELSVELTSLGVQVHGGMGYVEETGSAQHFRDARILPIYEGTTGIQAMDLVGRKTLMNQGRVTQHWLDQMRQDCAGHAGMQVSIDSAQSSLDLLLQGSADDPELAPSVGYHWLMQLGYLCGGWLMVRSADIAQRHLEQDPGFMQAKIHTAEFYCQQLLPRAQAHGHSLQAGSDCVMSLDSEQW